MVSPQHGRLKHGVSEVDSKLLGAIGLYLRPGTPGEKEAARGKVELLARKAGMTFDEAVSAYQNESETAKASAPDRWEDIFRDDPAMQEVMRKLQAEAQIKRDREARMWADKDRELQDHKARADRWRDRASRIAEERNAAREAAEPFIVVADLPADADLEARATSINRLIELGYKAEASASRHRIRAGQELLEARALLAHGEWLPWCKANIKRGVRDVQKLLKIASAPNPAAALEAENAQRRESSKAVKYATVAHLEMEIEAVEVIAAVEPDVRPQVEVIAAVEPDARPQVEATVAPSRTTPTIVLDASEYTVAPETTTNMQRAIAALRGLIGEFYEDQESAEFAKLTENALKADDAWLKGRIERMIEVMIPEAPANVEMAKAERKAEREASKAAAPVEVEVVAGVEAVEVELDRSAPWTYRLHAEPAASPTSGPDDRYLNRKARRAAMREAA
jgi:hypothetical protein